MFIDVYRTSLFVSSYSYYDVSGSLITYIDYSTYNRSYSPPILWLKNQIKVGDVYYQWTEGRESEYNVWYEYRDGILYSSTTSNYKDREIFYSNMSVLSLNASTTTPAGTFTNCVLLEGKAGDKEECSTCTVTWLVYYAPNIGMVAVDCPGCEDVVLDQLLSYHTYSGGSGPLLSVKTASVFSTQSLTNNNEVKGNLSKRRRRLDRIIKHLYPSFIVR